MRVRHLVASSMIFGALQLVSSACLAQQVPIERTLEELMRCKQVFKPALIIKALQDNGIIGKKPVSSDDGIPTFVVVKPIAVYGLEVKIVEGWARTGGVFQRGPGTAPPTHISLGFDHRYAKSLGSVLPKEVAQNEFGETTDRMITESNFSDRKLGSFPSLSCSLAKP